MDIIEIIFVIIIVVVVGGIGLWLLGQLFVEGIVRVSRYISFPYILGGAILFWLPLKIFGVSTILGIKTYIIGAIIGFIIGMIQKPKSLDRDTRESARIRGDYEDKWG